MRSEWWCRQGSCYPGNVVSCQRLILSLIRGKSHCGIRVIGRCLLLRLLSFWRRWMIADQDSKCGPYLACDLCVSCMTCRRG